MRAIILAAGRGSRLKNMTDASPKGMVKMSGLPLLEWQRRALTAAGVPDVTVVTGYRGEVIADYGFSTIVNDDWSRGNMVSSLARALNEFSGPMIVSYADILYEPATVRELLNAPSGLALTYDQDWLSLWRRRFDDPLSDAESFRLDAAGNVTEIGQKVSDIGQIEGQFMGLLKLEADGRKWIEDLLVAEPAGRLGFDTTGLLSKLIAAGHPVTGVPAMGGWCEIDTQSDLAVAEALIAEGTLNLVDDPRERATR